MVLKRSVVAVMLLVAVLFSVSAPGCVQYAKGEGEALPRPPQEYMDSFDPDLARTANAFGLNLMGKLLQEEENIFISPFSIATALAMTYNGARGETKEAMAAVLGIEGVELERLNQNNQVLLYLLQEADPSVKVRIANSLWAREGIDFDEEFIGRNENYYHASLRSLDFASDDAADIINSWVKERTGGHIEDIIEPPIHPLTILFLINAVYFQGGWSWPFDEKATREDTFYLPGGRTKTVPFMHRYGEMDYYEEEGFQALRLPYGEEEKLAMYLFLPSEELGLKGFFRQLGPAWWEEKRQRFQQTEGTLFLPRFTMEYEKTLNDALKELGMEVAFDENRADFWDMVPWEGSPRLFISEVKHKSFLEVNEKGTEAAAATSVEIKTESAPAVSFYLKVDRPFFFLIEEEATGAVPFMGTVADPS